MDAKLSTNRKFKRMFANILSIFVILAVAFPATGTVYAAGVWYVAKTGNDSNSCSSAGSPCATINGAIGKAIAGDTIKIATGTYTGTGTDVVLINKNIILSGGWNASFTTQSGMSTIDGQGVRRGVKLNSGVTATIERCLVKNGNAQPYGGSGIYNETNNTLILNNSVVDHSEGTGIHNYGTLTLNNSTVSGSTNSGIFNSGGTLTLNNSTLSGNIGTGSGGGGILNESGTTILNNSTVSNNTTTYGPGGGIYNLGGPVTLKNTIIAGNSAKSSGPDCAGAISSAGYNLIGNTSGCTFTSTIGDKVGTSASPINPQLAPLGNNGGPTFTHALYSDSPALDAGNPATPGSGGDACLATDQRGVTRPTGTACDIGAYEGFVPPAVTPQPLAPTGPVTDRTPTYMWSKITEATNYRYQLWKGTTLVYTKVVASSVCNATTCSNTPATALGYWGKYKWRVRAKVGGVWKPFSEYKNFTVVPKPRAGFWKGTALEFYVTPDSADVDNFAISIHVNGCGNYKITYTPLVPIENGKFAFSGSFHVNGKFSNVTHAKGTLGLSSYYIPGCGYVSGGPFNWTAAWNNTSQPSLIEVEEAIAVIAAPAPEVTSDFFAVGSDDR